MNHFITARTKDILDTLMNEIGSEKRAFLQTTSYRSSESPYNFEGLLFQSFGVEDTIYHMICTGANPFRPFAETIAIPDSRRRWQFFSTEDISPASFLFRKGTVAENFRLLKDRPKNSLTENTCSLRLAPVIQV